MKTTINKKLEEISKAKEQAVAHLNALLGAEQALKELLSTQNEE